MTNVLVKIFLHRNEIGVTFAFLFIVFRYHEMSLNIDMKIIRPLNSDGSLILDMNSWILLQSCNVVNPWARIPLDHHQLCPKFGIVCDELLNQLNFSSQAAFDSGFWFIFPRHNTESENTQTFACERLMTSSSLTKDNCFHAESSQSSGFNPYISSDCPTINFSDDVKHLFHREILPCFFD